MEHITVVPAAAGHAGYPPSANRVVELERLLAQERVANKLLAQENQTLLNELAEAKRQLGRLRGF